MSGVPVYDRAALQTEIIDRLSKGETLRRIIEDDHMPASRRTVAYWRNDDPDFNDAYAAAMVEGCHELLDGTLEIADNLAEDAQSRKLRIWARHELVKRKAPQVFGDRIQHANDPTDPMPAPQFVIQPVAPVRRGIED